MRAVEKLLGMILLLYLVAFIMLRNMVYIVEFDYLLTYRYFDPQLNRQSAAERMTSDKRESSSATRKFADVLEQPGKRRNSSGNSSLVINVIHQGRDVNKTGVLSRVEKNDTLLKTNRSHVGEIVKQLKDEPHSVKVAKPHPHSVKMTQQHPNSVKMTKPHPNSVKMTKPHPNSVKMTKPHPNSVKMTKPHPNSVKMTKPHPNSVKMTKPHPNFVKMKKQNSLSVKMTKQHPNFVKITQLHPQSFKVAKPHPFRYVINSPNVCGKYEVFLLVYVHTAPDHYKRRTVIRQTWGNMLQYTDPIRVVFFMGVSNLGSELNSTSALQKTLYFEQEQYEDLVQEDFLDTYHNLTHKGVSALKWISHNCRQAVFVLKTDDDIFVNMFSLMRHLKRMQGRGLEFTRGLLMCAVWYNAPVLLSGKWKVTKEEWKEEYYPIYCSGSAFILSTDVVEKLYKVSYHVPFFWVDDVYITGLLPLKAGNITHKQFKSTYILDGDRFEELLTGPSWYLYIFAHLQYLDRIQAVWQKMSRMARGEVPLNIEEALQRKFSRVYLLTTANLGQVPKGTYTTANLGEVPKGTYAPLPK